MNDVQIRPGGSVRRRAFLLITVIGILAVLLVLCVGFLSYSRGEVRAVAHVRDKNDAVDVFYSALDWSLANIEADLFDGKTFNPAKPVSAARNVGNWWYNPYEMGLTPNLPTLFGGGVSPADSRYLDASTEAPWIYLPADFFPGGSVRGRFAVQVFDPNACINVNDWNEDCAPTQCQMAHMLMEAFGTQEQERFRCFRDAGVGGGTALGWSTYFNLKSVPPNPSPVFYDVRYNTPLRYEETWRIATRTTRHITRYWAAPNNYPAIGNLAAPHWVTSNSVWMGLKGPDEASLRPVLQSNAIPQGNAGSAQTPLLTWSFGGSAYYYPVDPPDGAQGRANWPSPSLYRNRLEGLSQNNTANLTGGALTLLAYVDPDTGRSPVNVNTCFNSGDELPAAGYTAPSYTMEAVFNIESLRRIVKVGWFWTGTAWKNAQTEWTSLAPEEKHHAEELRTMLAYQYQETLCRYFTGTYKHPNQIGNGSDQRKFPPYHAGAVATYATAYGAILNEADWRVHRYGKGPVAGPQPLHAVTVSDYSATRFDTDLTTFRRWVRDDLLRMAQNSVNPAFGTAACPYQPLPSFNGSPTTASASLPILPVSPPAPPQPAPPAEDPMAVPPAPPWVSSPPASPPASLAQPPWPLAPFPPWPPPIGGPWPVMLTPTTPPRPAAMREPPYAAWTTTQGPAPYRSPTATRPAMWPPPPWPWPSPAPTPPTSLNSVSNTWRWPWPPTPWPWPSPDPPSTTSDAVNFDYYGRPQIAQGKLDMRTAAAVYDNIVPGKPADLNLFAGFAANAPGDPLWELCNMQVGRQEDRDDPYNVYGGWEDNPNLRALSRYTGGEYPSGVPVHLQDSEGNDLNLRRKGRDVARAGIPGPAGPWDDPGGRLAEVPYRQRAFSADCFSTELTTTTTTFFLVINAQLVDAKAVNEYPNDPTKHNEIFWMQWGAVVELAPDVAVESNTPAYYRSGEPRRKKTDPAAMDVACATLTTLNWGGSGERLSGSGGVPQNSSAIQDWRADLRGITPSDEDGFYSPGRQNRWRVILRSIWCLNQSGINTLN